MENWAATKSDALVTHATPRMLLRSERRVTEARRKGSVVRDPIYMTRQERRNSRMLGSAVGLEGLTVKSQHERICFGEGIALVPLDDGAGHTAPCLCPDARTGHRTRADATVNKLKNEF